MAYVRFGQFIRAGGRDRRMLLLLMPLSSKLSVMLMLPPVHAHLRSPAHEMEHNCQLSRTSDHTSTPLSWTVSRNIRACHTGDPLRTLARALLIHIDTNERVNRASDDVNTLIRRLIEIDQLSIVSSMQASTIYIALGGGT